MRSGVCTNSHSYYFHSRVSADFEAEECGFTQCGYCEYFLSDQELENDLRMYELERELERERRYYGL